MCIVGDVCNGVNVIYSGVSEIVIVNNDFFLCIE